MRFIIVIILTIAIGALSYIAFQKYNNPNTVDIEKLNEFTIYNSNKSEFDLEIEQIRSVQKDPKDTNSLQYYGWIPDWGMQSGLDTLKNNPHITSISPFWFDLNEDGSLKANPYTNWSVLLNYTKQNNIELVPAITSFERDKLTKVLNSKENSQRFINEVMSNVLNYSYDGIDLDFEHIYVNDHKVLLDLIETLSNELKRNNKQLHLSLLSKWGDNFPYGQTKAALDYPKLAKFADKIKLQGYGYSIAQDPLGPVGPLAWLEDVIRYSIKIGIPREKIVLGIHTYTMDWSIKDPIRYDLDYFGEQFFIGYTGGDGVAYYGDGLVKLFNNYVVEEEYVDTWGEVIGKYNFNGQIRAAVFPSNKSIEVRKQLAAEYGINGIAYWKLGGEGNLKL